MINFRSIVSVILAFCMVVLTNLGNVAVAKPKAVKAPTYTSAQIEQVQEYATGLTEIRDRLPELAELIQVQDWTFTRNFIHGPLGDIRFKMLYLTRGLLAGDQAKARDLSKSVNDNLVAIDQAAEKGDYKAAVRNYAETVRDLDALLQLVPQAS